ncbi:hypothetical protein BGW36DRAFT_457578 [Talaromyces proteolyticus]|uniref:SnoaL-like domain-containing protein n=1 Tax=Talaromyces proteolyticus TaxID=1131652 RepID=A0AAD4Q233_9EURO|nr:uncharacterized protein BGW36DRAFT_457578 [Talaromyces proteolyticus]KAH8703262.1 hypothetical protein BGW36DRAFT_457578 [Talaromyces proteolyticus]
MPKLASHLSGAEWSANGPQTAAQRFFKAYVDTVDSHGFNHGSGQQYYAKDAVFHNQNNVQYVGGDEMWAWMKLLFRQFRRLKHDWLSIWEIQNEDGTAQIISQNIRNIWLPENTSDNPSVSVPMSFICRIGPADISDAIEGLQFKEVWLYWDTKLLDPFLQNDAIVFRREKTFL